MVKGLDLFRERFRGYEGAFVLIGGAACDAWFTRQGLAFRATKDLDIVLVIEVIDPAFVAALRQFIDDGMYQIQTRTNDGSPVFYRFAKPRDQTFPQELELFSKKPDTIDLSQDQQIVPVAAGEDTHSLSAILLDQDYYSLIQSHAEQMEGITFATATALIPLKARAWLDLTARKQAGGIADSHDINKHRTDVFKLAATLPAESGPKLPSPILSDLASFLAEFPETAEEWPGILAALKPIFGGGLKPATLISTLKTFFRLP